jgi:phage terminase Nu1 subunit (DNA packaging protein)
MTTVEYAAKCGVSDRQVRNWRRAGRLVITSDGLIDPERSDRLRSATVLRHRMHTKTVETTPIPSDEAISGLESAKRRELEAKASLAELELAKQQKSLVEAARVRAAVQKLSRLTRDTLLGLPVRVAPALAACNDAHDAEQLLTHALRDALADIAKLTTADLEQVA